LGQFTDWQREVFIASKLSHENIVTWRGIMTKPLRTVMEYCNGKDLGRYLKKNGATLDWRQRIQILLDVAQYVSMVNLQYALLTCLIWHSGLEYLHSRSPQIIHRDLHSGNVFICEIPNSIQPNLPPKLIAKVGDFGLSRQFSSRVVDKLASWHSCAPEAYDYSSSGYTEKADVYCFAMICWKVAHPTR